MLDPKKLLSLEFYKASPRFTGSLGELCYQIEKTLGEPEEEGKKPPITGLKATCWKGPFNYATTPDEEKTSAEFPFSDDGLAQIALWIEQHTI